MQRLKKILHSLFWLLLSVYLLAAGALLAVRYGVLPHIDQFRPAIERVASRALGATVEIGSVHADWRGLNARFALLGVRVQGADGEVLSLPEAQAVMSWRSLVQGEPLFLFLEVRGLELTLRRDAQGNIHLAGPQGRGASDDPAASERVVRWLGRQQEWVLRDAILTWRDEQQNPAAPPLVLSSVQGRFINRYTHHAFGLSAVIPATDGEPAGSLDLRGEFDRRWFEWLANDQRWDARLYASVQGVDLQRWAAWLPLQQAGLTGGVLEGQVWGLLQDGQLNHVVLNMATSGVAWHMPQTEPSASGSAAVIQGQGTPLARNAAQEPVSAVGVDTGGFRFYADGPPSALWQGGVPAWLAPARPGQRVYVDTRFDAAEIAWPEGYGAQRQAVTAGWLAGELHADPAQGWRVAIRRLELENPDLAVSLSGEWHEQAGMEAGKIDVSGEIERFSLPALHRYFPSMVPEETREWLAQSFRAGALERARLVLQGNLAAFPFETPAGGADLFELAGDFDGMSLDYAPAHGASKGWPMLRNSAGRIQLRQNVLMLAARSGSLETGPGSRVAVRQAIARIEDLYRQEAVLMLQADAAGEARHYLALLNHSDLGPFLADTVLPQTQATGTWGVSLDLNVPLMHSVDSQVRGTIALQGGNVEIKPGIPVFEAVQGKLDFSNDGIVAQDISGQFLGGAYHLSGSLDRQFPEKVLLMDGSLPASSLAQWLPERAAARFGGEISYEAKFGLDAAEQPWLQVDSSLQGAVLDFPAPVGKPALARQSVSLVWGSGDAVGSETLKARIGNVGVLQLERDAAHPGTYFWRGALVDSALPLVLPEHGMALNLRVPEFDWEAWDQVLNDFEDDAETGEAILPPLQRVALAAERVHAWSAQWNKVQLQARHQANEGWAVDVDGDDLQGKLTWQASNGAHPVLRADFSRLAWPDADSILLAQTSTAAADDSEWSVAADFRLPDMELDIHSLAWRGHELGRLQLHGNNRDAQGDWRLDSLVLKQPGAVVSATGNWQVAGPGRGLSINLNAAITDLGTWLGAWGMEDSVRGSDGKLEAQLRWLDFPWRAETDNLSGSLSLSLAQGRFVHMRSRSARVLEVLSLQSLSRVFTLEARPGDAFKDGFPFDNITGSAVLSGEVLDIKALSVNGPAADVSLHGGTNLAQQRWNLQATVTPNLDASGASVAAGLVINPVVGVGAFLAQWLLKDPLARAMRLEYEVTGSWDDPEVKPLEKPARQAANDRSRER